MADASDFATKVAAGLYRGTTVEVTTANGKINAASEITYLSDEYGATESPASSGQYEKDDEKFSKTAFTAIGAATSGNQKANEYTVVVWLEGWDEDCTNAITAGTFKVDVSFTTAPRN